MQNKKDREVPYNFHFNLINTLPCSGNGFVMVIKTARGNQFRNFFTKICYPGTPDRIGYLPGSSFLGYQQYSVVEIKQRREIIRQMHEKIHPTDYQKSFHVYFLMGQPEMPDAELESRIQDELKLGDVIQYDQIDSYRQGSSKHFRTIWPGLSGRPRTY